MKINTKLTLVFLLISLIPLAVTGVLCYSIARKALIQQVLNQLESVVAIQKSRVESIVEQNLERLMLVASRTQLRLSLENFIKDPRSEYQELMNRILFDARSSIRDFKDISVLTLDGKVVASTNKAKIGGRYSDEEFFVRGQTENSADLFFIDKDKNLRVYLSGPLYLENRLLGVVVIESNLDNVVSLVKDYSGLGETGETLLARKDGNGDALFLTPLRFDEQAALRRTLPKDYLAAPINQALLKNVRLFSDAIDYRGKSVLAATQYIKKTDWGLVVKIDKAEAFAPIIQLHNLVWLIIFVSSIVVIIISLYVTRSITRPIINLTQVAGKISEGDLSRRAEVTSIDEVGILAQTFNRMAENLLAANTELERKVEQKTTELSKANQELKSEIIERKRAKETLHKTYEELEIRIKERTIELAKANQALQAEITERKRAEKELQRNYEAQTVINSLLRLSLEDIPLEELLRRTLDLLLSVPWLVVESRGSILLVEDDPEVLVMKAEKELEEALQKTCAQVPLGRCLCGRAALTREIQFANCLDDRHESGFEGMTPHGHYCVPILAADRTLGVINLYLRESHRRDQREEEFLTAVANTVAGIVMRRQVEEALRKSEASLAEAQRIAHLGNWDWDIINNKLRWSDEIYCIFGLTPQEFGATYEAFLNSVHPDDREFVKQAVDKALYKNEPYSIDHRIVLPDGSERMVHEQAEVFLDETGQAIRMVGTVQDITEGKQAEEELTSSREQLRNLSAHLQSVREEERTRIAREIHDELGQALTALKMDLSWLNNRLSQDQKPLLEKTKSMLELIDMTIQTVKKISAELRPGLLDDLGLAAAIEWQAEEFQNRTGIKCEVTLHPEDIILDQDRTTAIFRIFQETLTNVARHAKATRIKVSLKKEVGQLVLKVRDNGKGITPEQISHPNSYGLIGMRERAHFWGGEVNIRGIPNKGTTVTVSIPLAATGETR